MSGAHELASVWSEYVYDPIKFIKTFWPEVKLTSYQKEIFHSLADGTPETWVHSCNESGKCLGRDVPVMMFDGSVKMSQDVQVGDLLMGDDSTPRRVLSTTKGYGPLFRIRPKAKTHDKCKRAAPYLNEYVVNADHVLSLQWSNKAKGFATKDISVTDWLSSPKSCRNFLSGYRAGVEFEEKPVLVDPYFLGIWLGDGHRHAPAITTADKRIADAVYYEAWKRGLDVAVRHKPNNKASSYFITRRSAKQINSMTADLRSYGIMVKACEPCKKRVPDEYKINSRRVRSEVLAGLIDTDGESYSTGYNFVNKSKDLACDVVWLARSLGLGSDICQCKKKSSTGVVGTYYRVTIRGNGLPCRLHRKRPHHDSMNAPHRYGIIRVDPIGDGEYFGFYVDGNHRFLLGDFTVTHNSFLAAFASIWWFATRKSKVVTISTTEDQLSGVLWGEIGDWLGRATFDGKPFDFGFVRNDLEIRYRDDEGDPEPKYYLRGRVARKVESIQGNHLPTLYDPITGKEIGTVLFVVEEGSGIEDDFFPAIETQRHQSLIIGNPLHDGGTYAETCKAGDLKHPQDPTRLIRKVVWISGEHSPNVILGRKWAAAGRKTSMPREWVTPGVLTYERFLEREATLKGYEKRTRLYGLFPEEEGQKVFPSSWLNLAQQLGVMLRKRAQERIHKGRPRYPGKPFALGVDVSQGGGDLSAWVVWGRFGVVEVLAKETPNTTEIAGTTIQLMRKWRIDPAWVAFDAGGGGKQIADQLRDRGYENLLDVDFGGSALDKKKYKNKRAELYGELREAMQPGLMAKQMLSEGPEHWRNRKLHCASIPPDDAELRKDLAVLPLLRDSEGRLRMLAKEKPKRRGGAGEKCLRDLLGRSPDRGDACALAYFAWKAGQEFKSLEYIDGDLVY